MLSYLHPLTQNLDMVSAKGAVWRTWRTRFSHGFSPKNITALIPVILDEVAVFRDILRSKAGKDSNTWGPVFPLEPATTNLTFDIIVRASLDLRLHEQTRSTEPSPFKKALLDQLGLMLFEYNILTLPQILNPVRRWKMWRNTRAMREVLLPSVLSRVKGGAGAGNGEGNTIIDHALSALRREEEKKKSDQLEKGRRHDDAAEDIKSDNNMSTNNSNNENKTQDATADKEVQKFTNAMISNLKAFIFAGHDTTSATLCWALHSLSSYPAAASALRSELDAVLGPDPSTTIPQLRANPHLLHQLPYANAFVKEVLRLHPSAATIRVSPGEFKYKCTTHKSNPTGTTHVPTYEEEVKQEYPTKDFMLYDASHASMRSALIWERAEEFLPERWLAKVGDALYVDRNMKQNAWRPFGLGPRQCVGQELTLTEMKLALVVVAREVDVECAWGEWDLER